MAKKRHSAEQITRKLREAEVELAEGARIKRRVPEASPMEHKKIDIPCPVVIC